MARLKKKNDTARQNITIVIATYNERNNIKTLLDKIFKLSLENLSVLVVDDNSPDGTWQVVKEYSEVQPNVKLLRRKGPRSRGVSEVEGLRRAVICSEIIIEMDGDLSHHPGYIPLLLEKIKEADVVVGSRYTCGGEDRRRGFLRKAISRLAGLMVRMLWRIDIKDPTSGYRCFRAEVLQDILNKGLESRNQFIILETLKKSFESNYLIKEIPIIFFPRQQGKSKLTLADLFECFLRVLKAIAVN